MTTLEVMLMLRWRWGDRWCIARKQLAEERSEQREHERSIMQPVRCSQTLFSYGMSAILLDLLILVMMYLQDLGRIGDSLAQHCATAAASLNRQETPPSYCSQTCLARCPSA